MSIHNDVVEIVRSRILIVIYGLIFIFMGIINPTWAALHMRKTLDEALKGN